MSKKPKKPKKPKPIAQAHSHKALVACLERRGIDPKYCVILKGYCLITGGPMWYAY